MSAKLVAFYHQGNLARYAIVIISESRCWMRGVHGVYHQLVSVLLGFFLCTQLNCKDTMDIAFRLGKRLRQINQAGGVYLVVEFSISLKAGLFETNILLLGGQFHFCCFVYLLLSL